MMRLFWQDPYMKEFDAIVLDFIGNKIVLDKTAFYAESGGQIADTGTINGVQVLDTQYSGSGKTIYHTVAPLDLNKLRKKAPIHGVIDWDKRYKTMRHHSALHIVFLIFGQLHGDQKIIGSQVRDEKARVDFQYFEEVDIPQMQSRIDEIVAKNIPIQVFPSETDPDYRLWELQGYPVIPCGGTHVRQTSEIGKVTLKRSLLGSQGVRIYCALDGADNNED